MTTASPKRCKKGKVDSPDVVTARAGHSFDVVTAKAGHTLEEGEPTMKIYELKVSEIARDEEVFLGIDVAADYIAVCVLGRELDILRRDKILHTEAAVSAFLRRLPGCTVHAVYEAGPTGYQLLRWLRAAGCATADMVAPSKVPVLSGDRIKTDKRDALKLATMLATGQLRDATVLDLTNQQYADRQLVRSRTQLVKAASTIKQQIKSLMLMHGIFLPRDIKPTWSRRMIAFLAAYDSGEHYLNESLRELLKCLAERKIAVRRMNRLVKQLSDEGRFAADVQLLRTIPGFGAITSMTVLTEAPDIVARFDSGPAFARYLGLVPTENSTGAQQRRGGLTHDGNAQLRTALVEASWTLIKKDVRMKEVYDRIKARRRASSAICAIGRRLAMAIYAMFRDRKDFRKVDGAKEAAA